MQVIITTASGHMHADIGEDIDTNHHDNARAAINGAWEMIAAGEPIAGEWSYTIGHGRDQSAHVRFNPSSVLQIVALSPKTDAA